MAHPVSLEVFQAIRSALEQQSVRTVARQFGISERTVLAIAAGQRVHAGSLALVERVLERRARGEAA